VSQVESVASTIVRQWHLLTLLPKGPRRIDTATLEMRLRARGVDVHRRTIQRDLLELASVFPIVADERSKPYGWRWADDAELLCAIPALPGARDAVPEIELVLQVRRSAVRSVSEGLRGPEGQARSVRVGALDADVVEVAARVPDGCALRRWLFGFADAVEVIAPPELRAELAAKASRIASVYNGDA
jgi:predicted DNA-binding transcriptional regulator YafY